MPANSKSIQRDLESLILAQYKLPPKKFAQEELAVRQTMQKLLHELAQPNAQKSMLATVSVESIENMTRRGQLTLIAKNLDNSFLRTVELLFKQTEIEFEKDGEKILLSALYNQCKNDLMNEKGKEFNFGDILLRMYTEESPFYKKLNAIVGGYNDPKHTTEDEKKLALLLNVAIHKAGLDKRRFEVQQTPDDLYRGQSFGLENFTKKLEKVTLLHTQGKLATLSPKELAEVSIVDIVSKKIVSSSAEKKVSAQFATSKGVVLHIKNPEELADFYNVANISKFATEAEYITRIPDDIAMVPISITQDENDVSHIEVICIHSENVLLHNSTRLHDLRESLKDYIKNEINQSAGYFTPYFYEDTLNQKQMNLMEKLITCINESDKIDMLDIKKQDEFLETALLTLKELYKTDPTLYQKEGFDMIKILLQDYAAIIADFKVVHENYNSEELISQEQKTLNANLEGKRVWMASISGKTEEKYIEPIKNDLNKLVDPTSSRMSVREAANNILQAIKSDAGIALKFPTLNEGMTEVINSLDQIEKQQKMLEEKVLPSTTFKMALLKAKEEATTTNELHEEKDVYESMKL